MLKLDVMRVNSGDRWRTRREELRQCRKVVERENRSAFRLLSFCGLLISVFNYLAQLVVAGAAMPLFRSGLLATYFALLIFIDRCLLREDGPLATRWIYVAQAPVMVLAILLGTVWDPTHQAITIMLFLMFLPVFVMDYTLRFLAIQALWTLLFSGLCALCKQPPVLYSDLIHALEFYVASCALMYVVSSVRMLSIRRQLKMKYNLTHDPDTGCQNRIALEERQEEYLNREQIVVIGELDRLVMVNDFYGIDASNAASRLFTRTLMELFGADRVYVQSGKETLCIPEESDLDACLDRVKLCRKRMHAFEFEGKRIPMTCAFGYTVGSALDPETFSQMRQYAEILMHRAENTGHDQTGGGPFNRAAFMAAAAESNNSAAQPYEISALTGLPRLYYFMARTGEVLQNVVDITRRPVVGFIHLTRMREYNDTIGYERGDELIREAARQLRRAFYSRVLCHVTAGQFCVLCYRDEAEPGILHLCEALREFHQGDMVDCKAGFAEYTGSEQAITLIDRARMAQKSILPYRNQHLCFYDAVLDGELRFRQYIVSHLDEAIEKGHLIAYFQPIMRAATGKVCCEEALARWKDPNNGLLMPYRFIPPLEDNGLMYKVNLHMVELVLENFRRRQADGVPIVPVSVNLSRKDFNQCDMVQEIIDRVDRSGFPRDLLRIEITESAFTEDQKLLRREIGRFRASGFQVWLDDFGSEYSTLNLLEDIDFDLIKIDMKFMRNFTGEGKNFVIVSHTIDMAREMGMTTLMEGIETEEQYRFMQKLHCDMVQGYLFNKPNPYEYILERARRGMGLPFETAAHSLGEAGLKERPHA